MKVVQKSSAVFLVLILIACFIPNPSFAVVSVYLQVEGVPGDSTERNHVDWIEALSFSQKMTQSATLSTSGSMAGRAVVGDFFVTKFIDRSSPLLNGKLLSGTIIRKVVLEVLKATSTGTLAPVQRFTLEEAIVTSITMSGPEESMIGQEIIGFNASRIKWEYFIIDSRGQQTGSVVKMWDVLNNREITESSANPTPTKTPLRPTNTPTARPTSTRTPTPLLQPLGPATMTIPAGTVLVTDDFNSIENICGRQDTDAIGQRELMIRWNLNVANAVDYHVYVQVDGGTPAYLGRTGSGDTRYFLWNANTANVADAFRSGPEGKHEFLFQVIAMVPMPGSTKPAVGGKWTCADPVVYVVE